MHLLAAHRWSRAALAGVIAALCLVMIPSQVRAAEAARFGAPSSFTIGDATPTLGDYDTCTGQAQWAVSGTAESPVLGIRVTANCRIRTLFRGPQSVSIVLNGLRGNSPCSYSLSSSVNYSTGALDVQKKYSFITQRSFLVESARLKAGGSVCHPTEIEIRSQGRSSINLGAIPTLGADPDSDLCERGRPTSAEGRIIPRTAGQNDSDTRSYGEARVRFPAGVLTNSSIRTRVVTNRFDGGIGRYPTDDSTVTPAGSVQTQWLRSSTYTASGWKDGTTVRGVQVSVTLTGTPSLTNFNIGGTNQNQSVGITSPAHCVWYFGDPIWDESTMDPGIAQAIGTPYGSVPYAGLGEPAGGVTPGDLPAMEDGPDPTAPASQCNFSLTDPGSWLSGGMCAMVGLLGTLIDAVMSVVTAVAGLVGEIGEMLISLFVPDVAIMQGHLETAQTAWAETPVGEVVDAGGEVVTQLSSIQAGGCEGPALTISPPHVGTTTLHPMSACSGPVSTIAGVVKAGLTISLWIGALLVSLRVLGAAFGLNLNGVGRSD